MMNSIKTMLLAIAILVCGCYCRQTQPHMQSNNSRNLYVGVPCSCCQTIDREGYALGWSQRLMQPHWVQYELTEDEVVSHEVQRSNAFKFDPSVDGGSSVPDDYLRSGYDRGHLAPAADMQWSKHAMEESFLMSNMSPQTPMLNRQTWAKLEAWTRKQAQIEKNIVVVSGPICTNQCPKKIGKSQITVPDAFFKALLDTTPPCKAIAFIVPNVESNLISHIQRYIAPIEDVERATGLQLFFEIRRNDPALVQMNSSALLWSLK